MTAVRPLNPMAENGMRSNSITWMPSKVPGEAKIVLASRNFPSHSHSSNGDSGYTEPMDDESGNSEASSKVNNDLEDGRTQPVGDDHIARTIEFLRARLLSERASSKAAREQAQQSAKRVLELQSQLEIEIEQRKKAEAAAEGALARLRIKGLTTEFYFSSFENPGKEQLHDCKEENAGTSKKSEIQMPSEEISTKSVSMYEKEEAGCQVPITTCRQDNDSTFQRNLNSHWTTLQCESNAGSKQLVSEQEPARKGVAQAKQNITLQSRTKVIKDLNRKSNLNQNGEATKDLNQHGEAVMDLQQNEITRVVNQLIDASQLQAIPGESAERNSTNQAIDEREVLVELLEEVQNQKDKNMSAHPEGQRHGQVVKLELQGWEEHVVTSLVGRPQEDLSVSKLGIFNKITEETNCTGSETSPTIQRELAEKCYSNETGSLSTSESSCKPDSSMCVPDLGKEVHQSMDTFEAETLKTCKADNSINRTLQEEVNGKTSNGEVDHIHIHETLLDHAVIAGGILEHTDIEHTVTEANVKIRLGSASQRELFISNDHDQHVAQNIYSHLNDRIQLLEPSPHANRAVQLENLPARLRVPVNDQQLTGILKEEKLPSEFAAKKGIGVSTNSEEYMAMHGRIKSLSASTTIDTHKMEYVRKPNPQYDAVYLQGKESELKFPLQQITGLYSSHHYQAASLADIPGACSKGTPKPFSGERKSRVGDILEALHLTKAHIRKSIDEQHANVPYSRISDDACHVSSHSKLPGPSSAYPLLPDDQHLPYEIRNWNSYATSWSGYTSSMQSSTTAASHPGSAVTEGQNTLRRTKSTSESFMMPTSFVETYHSPRRKVHLGNGITLYTD